jgi:hypothetical protein
MFSDFLCIIAIIVETLTETGDEMLSWVTGRLAVFKAEVKYHCYRLYCAVFGRYNAVVCQTLSPRYNDADELLLHANFQILVDFIEREKPWQFNKRYDELYAIYSTNCRHDEAIARCVEWENLTRLYHWWKRRSLRYTVGNDFDEDSKQLIRLVAARARLWT